MGDVWGAIAIAVDHLDTACVLSVGSGDIITFINAGGLSHSLWCVALCCVLWCVGEGCASDAHQLRGQPTRRRKSTHICVYIHIQRAHTQSTHKAHTHIDATSYLAYLWSAEAIRPPSSFKLGISMS
jgi:hypothetical protein